VTIRIEEGGKGLLTIDVSEVFDTVDASSIREAMECAGPSASATIDLLHARRCEPRALALLAEEIVARPGRIAVLGIGLHERRLLGYFGVPEHDTAMLGAPRRPEPRFADEQLEESRLGAADP
jgi:hypothetical protein